MDRVNHTFVICAYQESRFLEECILSLKKQTVLSEIIMATSTPNDYIREMALKYEIPLYINTGEKGIVQDWNFAYRQAKTRYVTIAHQDDVYEKEYTRVLLGAMEKSEHPLIGFTDYREIRNGVIVDKSTMLRIKRWMLWPLSYNIFRKSRFVRRRILSLGCPICCPSVMYHKENLPKQIFKPGYRSDQDWQAWERLSRIKGEFVYVNKKLTLHRIHEESTTTAILGDNARRREDYEMFLKFWPPVIAKLLGKLYSKSEKSNDLTKN
ncbi:MAG: Glyco-trans-2-like domain-containing protein [Lachnoclostridium sp.]